MRGIGFALCARALAVAPLVVVAWLLGLGGTWVSGAAAASPVVEGQPLDRSAGWHGRAVRDVHRHERRAVSRPAGSSGALRPGTGADRPGGSVRVRELQRRLRGLGYRPGPVDGVLGPRTRAAAAWFAHKHGLRISAAVDAATVSLLRERSRGAGERGPRERRDARQRPAGRWRATAAARRGAATRTLGSGRDAGDHFRRLTTDGVASGTWLVIGLSGRRGRAEHGRRRSGAPSPATGAGRGLAGLRAVGAGPQPRSRHRRLRGRRDGRLRPRGAASARLDPGVPVPGLGSLPAGGVLGPRHRRRPSRRRPPGARRRRPDPGARLAT